jgi:hypothetical protein
VVIEIEAASRDDHVNSLKYRVTAVSHEVITVSRLRKDSRHDDRRFRSFAAHR